MTELRDLEARIRALEDIEAIKRLKHKYFRCIDKGLWDEIGNCFAEDAVADYIPGTPLQGRAAIAKFFTENVAPAYSMCVHQGHNPEIELTSDTAATGIWELDNFMVTAKTNVGFWIAAFYEDEYVKEKGEWKIKRTKVDFFFFSNIEKGWAKERFSPVPEL
jgi:bile-acid 7alpha-dehydratase